MLAVLRTKSVLPGLLGLSSATTITSEGVAVACCEEKIARLHYIVGCVCVCVWGGGCWGWGGVRVGGLGMGWGVWGVGEGGVGCVGGLGIGWGMWGGGVGD